MTLCSPSSADLYPAFNTQTQPLPSKIRKADFRFNKDKQLRKLGQDANRPDVEIEVNNSGENVNVRCSTGFYAEVVIPSIKDICPGFSVLLSGLLLNCYDVVGNIDAVGSKLKSVLYFRLHQQKTCIGGVTMHLHHSTRLVQVQGSAILPDNSHSPVWFVDNFLRHRILPLASSMAHEVHSFNKLVREMVDKHLNDNVKKNLCAGCNEPFNRNSSPVLCSFCDKLFHRHKCIDSFYHQCYSRSRLKSSNSNDTLSSLPTTAAPSPPRSGFASFLASTLPHANSNTISASFPSSMAPVVSTTGESLPGSCQTSSIPTETSSMKCRFYSI